MSIVLEDKRANRGSGMSAFIGRAEDEKFWKEEMTLEESESEDDSFVDEEADKPDEFDSDFNDSEDDADEDLSDEESQVKATARRKEVILLTFTNEFQMKIYAADKTKK